MSKKKFEANITVPRLKYILSNLELMRDNFGDIPKLKEIFGSEKVEENGVCILSRVDLCGWDTYSSIVKRWPALNPDFSAGYPIGGLRELTGPATKVWNNARRLDYINYLIVEYSRLLRIFENKLRYVK